MILIPTLRLKLRHTISSKKIVKHMKKRSRTSSERTRRLEDFSLAWFRLFSLLSRAYYVPNLMTIEARAAQALHAAYDPVNEGVPCLHSMLSGDDFLVIMQKSSNYIMREELAPG